MNCWNLMSNDFYGLKLYGVWSKMLTNNLIDPNIKFIKSNDVSRYYLPIVITYGTNIIKFIG